MAPVFLLAWLYRQQFPVGRLRLLAITLLLFSLPVTLNAREQTFEFGGSVEAGEIYTLRLRNIPAGAQVAIDAMTDGEARILLLSHDDRRRWPDSRHPLFEGRTDEALEFSVTVAETGHYYLVVDNRRGLEPREFAFQIRAAYEGAVKADDEAKDVTEPEELSRFRENLRTFFIFDDFDFVIGQCNSANAYASAERVLICVKVARRIRSSTEDPKAAQHVLFFMTMHEIGHVLLRQWGYPFYDNEEIADEFATMLLRMFGHEEVISDAADFLEKQSSDVEFEAKLHKDDRHPLSVQRARNLRAWLERPELVRQWQKILVPNMQTEVLVALKRHPKNWVDREAIDKELTFRKSD